MMPKTHARVKSVKRKKMSVIHNTYVRVYIHMYNVNTVTDYCTRCWSSIETLLDYGGGGGGGLITSGARGAMEKNEKNK